MTLLKDYAYYATGGTADAVYQPATVDELAACVKEIRKSGKPWFLLGGGTNSLVMDEHFPGAVVLFRKLQTLAVDGATLTVGAGVENTAIAKEALKRGLQGAAWMNRLPGQLGGTVRMNARCYGGEISQIVTKVWAVTPEGEVEVHSGKAMFKGYKDTIFITNGQLVAQAELALAPGDPIAIEEKMRHCEDDRVKKGQFDFPSCGCVFKNDYGVGLPSGMLLEASGAKALKRGGAEVSPYHANFVYNKGATSRDILELTLEMRDLVYDKLGAWMEYEMEILGRMPDDLARKVAVKKPHRLNEAALKPLREKMRGKLS